MEWIVEASPRIKARIAGVFYVFIFVAAPSGAASATPTKMLITLTCDTAVALIFFDLLRPVSRSLSFLAAFFRLIFVAIMTANSLDYFGHMVLLKGKRSSAAFNTGYKTALVFFGFHCLLIGYLIFRSTYLPRILGVLMALAALGYLIFLSPPLADYLSPYNLVPGALGEASLTLWLLVVGVDLQRWKEQANATGASIRI
jgi:hypothetical protein